MHNLKVWAISSSFGATPKLPDDLETLEIVLSSEEALRLDFLPSSLRDLNLLIPDGYELKLPCLPRLERLIIEAGHALQRIEILEEEDEMPVLRSLHVYAQGHLGEKLFMASRLRQQIHTLLLEGDALPSSIAKWFPNVKYMTLRQKHGTFDMISHELPSQLRSLAIHGTVIQYIDVQYLRQLHTIAFHYCTWASPSTFWHGAHTKAFAY